MFGCADVLPIKLTWRLFVQTLCSQSQCVLRHFALSALPPCLLKVMRTAVMVPFGSHIWPSVSVTASSFFLFYFIFFFYCGLLYNLQILVRLGGKEQRCTNNPPRTVSVGAISPLFQLRGEKYSSLTLFLFLSPFSLYLEQKLAVHLGTRAYTW